MALTVKKKIWLGTSFFFLLLLIIGGVGIHFVAKLKAESKNILQANYESLAYCHTMQQQMNTIDSDYVQAVNTFENALKQQEGNITEPGEKEATNNLRVHFNLLKSGDTTHENIKAIQIQIQSILFLNMQAIEKKGQISQKIAENALTIIISLGSLVFLIALSFMVNFPSIVTNPISHLTEAIKEISNKNYKHRIHIESKDEFGKLADSFNDMAERLEYFESGNLNKLMFEKRRAEAVINSMKDASIGIDKNNVILFANFQALQLLGLHSEEVLGRNANELKNKNDLFRFLIDTNTAAPFKIAIENRENYFVKEVVEVIQDEERSRVIVLKNITSFKELDVAKTNFISTISHELKTPLASSDFSLKLLKDERISKLSPEQKELIEHLEQDNQRMLKILSELLNMSQIETGRIQLEVKEVSPSTIITSGIDTVALSAKEKDIIITDITSSGLPSILADADKTIWVLNNLLTNAIKYSKPGGIIEVKALQVKNEILFSVKDAGPGIPGEFLTKVFDRYYKVPGSKEKGTGLGLAISKEFILAQKGKIWVESEIGKGSVFYFSLLVLS
jgi:NtrC-family two-component system sensor histidine kinase KinB